MQERLSSKHRQLTHHDATCVIQDFEPEVSSALAQACCRPAVCNIFSGAYVPVGRKTCLNEVRPADIGPKLQATLALMGNGCKNGHLLPTLV